MFKLTDIKDDFYVHVVCGCGLKFRAEEMYICYK